MTNKPSFRKNITTRICFTCEGKKSWLKMISKDHQNVLNLDTFFKALYIRCFLVFNLYDYHVY